MVVLDVRHRNAFARHHREGAVNIPVNEVFARSSKELPSSSHIVVDCLAELGPLCGWVGSELGRQGFANVSLLSSRALFMTVWRPSTRSAENSCGIRQG